MSNYFQLSECLDELNHEIIVASILEFELFFSDMKTFYFDRFQ